MQKVSIYSNTARLEDKDRAKLTELITESPLGIYKTSFEMGVMPQAIYRLMEGKGVKIDTLAKVQKWMKRKTKKTVNHAAIN